MTIEETTAHSAAAVEGHTDPRRRRVERLYLSGGSNRAALGALGAISYLIYTGRWKDVEEVISVSGGSLLNGTLANGLGETAGAADNDDVETLDLLTTFIERLEGDRLMPWATPRRVLISLAVLTGLIVSVFLMVAAVGVTGPANLSDTPWSVLAALVSPLLLLRTIRWGFGRYTADYAANLARCPGVTIDQPLTRRLHVICATGLSEGKPYYFFVGSPRHEDGYSPEPSWGRVIATGYELQQAMAASASLPGASTVKSPKGDSRYGIRETLIDGGTSGNFGQQFSEPLERRFIQDGKLLADGKKLETPDRVLVKRELGVDAGFAMKPSSGLGRFLGRHSYLARLVRWLQVSNEAVYANDLTDLQRDQLVQLCSSGHLDRTGNVRDDLGRRNLAGLRSPGERRLDELRRRTARVPKFRPSQRQVAEAITTGVLAAMSTLDGEDLLDAKYAQTCLEDVQDKLGLGNRLTHAWVSGARTAFFELQPAPFAISHGGVANEPDVQRLSRQSYVNAVKEGFTCVQVDVELGLVDGCTALVSDHSSTGRRRPFKVEDLEAHPTLASLLDDHVAFPVPHPVTGGGVFWNVEIKSSSGEQELYSILNKERDKNRLHRICISSPFQRRMLDRLRADFPQLATNESLTEGALVGYNLMPLKPVVGAAGVQLPKRSGLQRATVDRKRNQGRHVQAWVAADELESYDLRRHGVSGIIADDPALAKTTAEIAAKGPLLEHPRISLFENAPSSWTARAGTILLATASPRELAPIQASEEFQAIHAVVDEADSAWTVHEHAHATNTSLLAAIRRTKPNIVHIAGRGSPYQGILLEDEDNNAESIWIEEFVKAVDEVDCRLVILAAANADRLAAELAERGVSTVSMSADVDDESAVALSEGLYRALLLDPSGTVEDLVARAGRVMDSIKLPGYRRTVPSNREMGSPIERRRHIPTPPDDLTVSQSDGIWWSMTGVGRRSSHFLAAPPVGHRNFTVLAWVRRDSFGGERQWFADTRARGGVGHLTHGWLFGFLGSGELLFSLSGTAEDWARHWAKTEHLDRNGNPVKEKHLRPAINFYKNPERTIQDDEWHMVAARVRFDCGPAVDDFGAPTEATLFIDGEVCYGPKETLRGWHGGVTGHSLLLGTGVDYAGREGSTRFDGEVADLAVFYRDLSDAEIMDLCKAKPHLASTDEDNSSARA